MKEIISVFFHCIGFCFSIFLLIGFFLTMYCDSQEFLWGDVLILLIGILFVYAFARFIGWVVNVIIGHFSGR